MNYNNIYQQLIYRAKNRSILPNFYKENHHIKPKAIGGVDTSNNMVLLFPEEHLIAHLLLVKIYPNEDKLIYAANMMCNGSGSVMQHRVNKSKNKQYKWLKEKFISTRRENMVGCKNHRFGKKMSEETKQKIGDSNRGKPSKLKGRSLSDETKQKIKITLREKYNSGYISKSKGFKHSDDSKHKISENRKGKTIGVKNSMFGKTHSLEVKQKLREKNLKNWRIKNLETGLEWIGKDIDIFCNKYNLVKGSLQDVARARRKNPNFNYTYRKIWVCDFVETETT